MLLGGDGQDAAGPLTIAAHGAGLAVFGHAEHGEGSGVVHVEIALLDADHLVVHERVEVHGGFGGGGGRQAEAVLVGEGVAALHGHVGGGAGAEKVPEQVAVVAGEAARNNFEHAALEFVHRLAFQRVEGAEGVPLAVVLRLGAEGLALEQAAGRRGVGGARVARLGPAEGARPAVKAERGGGVGGALQVVELAAAVGVEHADVHGVALLFGDEEEERLAEVVVAPLLARLRAKSDEAFDPLAGIGHGLSQGGAGGAGQQDQGRADMHYFGYYHAAKIPP